MRALRIIAKDTITELSRRKILVAILLAVALTAVIFITATAFVPVSVQKMAARMTSGSTASPEQMEQLVKQLTMQGHNLLVSVFSFVVDVLGTLLALLMFATFLPAEIERGSIKFLISKPVSRQEVLMGKWLGGVVVILCYSAAVTLLQVIASVYLTGGLLPDDIRTFPFLFCKLLIRGSVAMCLSIAMKPILAGVLAFFVSGDIFTVVSYFMGRSAAYYIFSVLSYLLPNYAAFSARSFFSSMAHAMGASVPEFSVLDIAVRVCYALIYSALMLILAIRQFNRKDLT